MRRIAFSFGAWRVGRTGALLSAAGLLLLVSGCGGGSSTSSSGGSGTTTTETGGGGAGGTTTTGGADTGGTGGVTTGGTGGTGGVCEPVAETCDGVDNDCDGELDNGDPGGGDPCPTGLNGICAEGMTHCIQGVVSCVPVHGPGEVQETCNGQDDDCDGVSDEGLPEVSYFKDDDGDGYGTQASVQACSQPVGYAAKSGDCNDNNVNINPGAIELCNDADDNCNGFNDEGVQKPTFFKDNDGDGYGGVSSTLACTAPMGYVQDSGDCNDFNANIHPLAAEACNDLDDDCNGLIDDGLPTQTIYKDNDGDGIAPVNAATQQKCNVPVGWALPVDKTGDGTPDWDCNDSDVTVYPGAPTVCDGKDNNCDGVVDRLCFTTCAGSWGVSPPQPTITAGGVYNARMMDLDGNGKQEIVFQSDSAFAVIDYTGAILYQEGTGALNWSRNQALVADIDTYDQYSPSVQTMEILTGNNSKLTYYKLTGNTVTKIASNHDVYDASPLMARDMDGDGVVELFTTSWCVPTQGTRVFRYDRNTNTMTNVIDVADPDAACEYTDGRSLTDLDGDGRPELVFGNGYAHPQTLNTWKGNIHVRKFDDLATLANTAFCPQGVCFPTAVPNLFGGGVGTLFRIGGEIRASDTYFTQQVVGAPSTARYWGYDLTGMPDANSPSATNTLWNADTDVDDDDIPENSTDVAFLGLFDVNGDGNPDRITSSGAELRVQLWDPATKTFVTNPGSSKTISATNVVVRSVWDIDGSGHLAVISTDASHNVYCHQLGPQTWLKNGVLPPHFPTYLRTYQWDNYEPNDGQDTNNDGVPDAYIRVPSALTSKEDFYGYISTPTDKDYYLIDGGYSGPYCLTSPKTASFTLKVFSFFDKTAPAGPDGLIWTDSSAAKTKCFSTGSLTPNRNGEYRFILGVESQGTASPFWPYWIKAAK